MTRPSFSTPASPVELSSPRASQPRLSHPSASIQPGGSRPRIGPCLDHVGRGAEVGPATRGFYGNGLSVARDNVVIGIHRRRRGTGRGGEGREEGKKNRENPWDGGWWQRLRNKPFAGWSTANSPTRNHAARTPGERRLFMSCCVPLRGREESSKPLLLSLDTVSRLIDFIYLRVSLCRSTSSQNTTFVSFFSFTLSFPEKISLLFFSSFRKLTRTTIVMLYKQ